MRLRGGKPPTCPLCAQQTATCASPRRGVGGVWQATLRELPCIQYATGLASRLRIDAASYSSHPHDMAIAAWHTGARHSRPPPHGSTSVTPRNPPCLHGFFVGQVPGSAWCYGTSSRQLLPAGCRTCSSAAVHDTPCHAMPCCVLLCRGPSCLVFAVVLVCRVRCCVSLLAYMLCLHMCMNTVLCG